MLTIEQAKIVLEKIKEKTNKEAIVISPFPNKNLTIFDSKFGGLPYLSKETPVPVDSEGNQLALLAQINCNDLPKNNIYPKEGLLQFWIGHDDIMGLDDKNGYKVIYYKDIDINITENDILSKYNKLDVNNEDEYSPYYPKDSSFSLTFESTTTSISSSTYDFEEVIIDTINNLYPKLEIQNIYDNLSDEVVDYIFDELHDGTSIIGGYPTFVQWDPREYDDENKQYSVLLLQIDSEWNHDAWPTDERYEIMWGDAGISNFFIKPEDLKQLNFEDILYNWDCS